MNLGSSRLMTLSFSLGKKDLRTVAKVLRRGAGCRMKWSSERPSPNHTVLFSIVVNGFERYTHRCRLPEHENTLSDILLGCAFVFSHK